MRLVDNFLYNRVVQKLVYWSFIKSNVTGRNVIAYSVLLYGPLFFLSIWDETKKKIECIRGLVINYIAAGTMKRALMQVNYIQCC